ncbi:MAG: sugar porter family MFS transporter [Bacteroidota bacterium]|nr:sugar porter family MFS transporter [Bacteroidota bacterium]
MMKYNKRYTVLTALIVALGGFLLGFDSAVISGAVPFIKEYFVLNDIQLGWSVSCLILGAMLGNSVAGPLSDRFGRKNVLIFTALLFAISAVSSALATQFGFFIVARIIGGIGVGGAILIAPIYIAEIAPAEKRGQLVSFNQLNIVIGISAAYFSNYFLLEIGDNNWRWMLGVEAIPAIIYFSLLFIVPMSPRWLYRHGNKMQARIILEKIGGPDYAKSCMAEIQGSIGGAQAKSSIGQIFAKKYGFIIFIGLTIAFFQQITGINAVFYYAPTIFEQAGGGTEAAFLQAVVVGLTNLAFTIVAIFLIDRLGRKSLLIIGASGMTIALTVLGLSFDKSIEEINTAVVLSSVLLYVASFAISFGPVMWALLSEIFPNMIRGIAISVVGFFNSLVSFSVTLVFPWELTHVGPSGTFFIFGGMALLSLLFAVFFVPETKGKSLEQLEKELIR